MQNRDGIIEHESLLQKNLRQVVRNAISEKLSKVTYGIFEVDITYSKDGAATYSILDNKGEFINFDNEDDLLKSIFKILEKSIPSEECDLTLREIADLLNCLTEEDTKNLFLRLSVDKTADVLDYIIKSEIEKMEANSVQKKEINLAFMRVEVKLLKESLLLSLYPAVQKDLEIGTSKLPENVKRRLEGKPNSTEGIKPIIKSNNVDDFVAKAAQIFHGCDDESELGYQIRKEKK